MKTPILFLVLGVLTVCAWGAEARPNIVFVLADDLDFNSISDNLGKTIDGTVFMPRLKALADQGLTFTNAYVTFSLCCPSRVSILRGQYPHNTGVLGNGPPLGGFQVFYRLGRESSTIATWLKDAGYQTALIGKYLNNYPDTASAVYVPPGWNEWRVRVPRANREYYDYFRVENGVRVDHGSAPTDYLTDVETADVARFIRELDDRPFFMYLAPFAPHEPATPATRHANLFPSARVPKPPSFNEADISDKPAWIKALRLMTSQRITQIDAAYRERLQSMMAVDDMIGRVVDELRAKGKLDNTYIFFTSDHGYHMGQHRLVPAKNTAYEEDIRVPLIVVGPGVPHGERPHPVLNIDFAPTFAALAGVTASDFVDGRSYHSLLTNQPPLLENWRSSFLIEYAQGAAPMFSAPTYHALRIQSARESILYNELNAGPAGNAEYEFYDLKADPFQLDNRYSSLDATRRTAYARLLADLKSCRAAGCRAAENTRTPTVARTMSATGIMGSVQSDIQTASWAAIYGTSLADTTADWTGRIANGVLPTTLEGVRVTMNGTLAPIYFVSPGQINVQVPELAPGLVQVVVTKNGVASTPTTAQVRTHAPAFFHWGATKYAVATRYPDNALVGPPALLGAGYVPAKPRDILILWATGFGPTNPSVRPGLVTEGAPTTATAPTVSVGGMAASVIGAALSPGLVGVYQLAVQLPDSVPTGDVLVRASISGFQTPENVFLFVSPN